MHRQRNNGRNATRPSWRHFHNSANLRSSFGQITTVKSQFVENRLCNRWRLYYWVILCKWGHTWKYKTIVEKVGFSQFYWNCLRICTYYQTESYGIETERVRAKAIKCVWEKETMARIFKIILMPSVLYLVGFVCFSIKLSYLNTIEKVF